ncbi:hypothetical protein, partial [Lentilactobacillus parabuchneri]|uniref:hypothetical protein n=1 Tax=Lentilactobacillus parabuchneri TaxID=152331 RepID=UPI0019592BF4
LAKMMANLSHIFGWIEKLSHIFQKKWKMRLNLFVGGTYVPATFMSKYLLRRDRISIKKSVFYYHNY